jgi:hypothetical protein
MADEVVNWAFFEELFSEHYDNVVEKELQESINRFPEVSTDSLNLNLDKSI